MERNAARGARLGAALGLWASLGGACRPAEPPPPAPAAPEPAAPPPAPASASAPAASASAPRAGGPCGDLREKNLAQLPPDRHEKPSTTVALSGACYAAEQGAWGLRLIDWKLDDGANDRWGGRLKISHFSGDREVSWAPPRKSDKEPEGIPLWYGLDYSDLQPPRLVDLDGDKEPEIFVSVHQKEHEGPGYVEAYLLTFKNGAITPYPGAPPTLEALEDIDRDGRVDILYYPYRETREGPCSGFGYRWSGPAHLAHGLAGGGFSVDDEVALAYLKRACPAPPGPFKKPPPLPTNTQVTAGDAPAELCALIWGQPEAQATSLLRQQCKKPKNDQEHCQPPDGACSDYGEREGVLKKKPPVRLAEPGGKKR